jgi:hypothetical protein
MNFVIELFESKDFNAILMIVDRLTKMHHYISCTAIKESINVEETARLLMNQMWKLHELSNFIVSNRDLQFVSLVWKKMCKVLKIDVKLSTAFHSETNDQSEIVNQEMKRYLRNYCNYQQNDWSDWLSMTEFVFNAVTSTFIELFAFMTNYEFESRMSFDSSDSNDSKKRLSAKERILTQKAANITDKMKNIWNFIKKKLANTQESRKRYANKTRIISFDYVVENIVWLFIKNIKIERSSKKLNHKWIDFYKIKKVMTDVFQLNLSSSMKIHDTFHIFLLRKVVIDSLTKQIQSLLFSVAMNEEEEYEINDILDSRYHYDKLQYEIAWIDHSSDRAWYSAENFEHFKNILEYYHRRYSEKLDLTLRLLVTIEAMLSQWIRDEHKKAKQLIQNVLNKMKAKMKENDQMRSKFVY